jgi:hypothetical protein
MDYTLSEVARIKKALELKILQGLSELFFEFTKETGMAVNDMRVGFLDTSTLQQIQFIPQKVSVNIICNHLSISDKEFNEKNYKE